MAFLRPELKEWVQRWREALIGAVVSTFGIVFYFYGEEILAIIGISLAIAGALLVFAGIQKGRFRTGGGGVGVVEIDEGQITYFGPYEGGTVSIQTLAKVELDPAASPSDWVLTDPGQPPLRIPTDAEGADRLFDVFASLENIRTERLVEQLRSTPDRIVTVWEKPAPAERAIH